MTDQQLAPAAPVSTHAPASGMRPAWIVDVDGTLAIMQTGPLARGPFDWRRVAEDDPNPPVIAMVEALAATAAIIVMSGRDETCRPETESWLATHLAAPTADLLMRPAGDYRKDAVIKRELFHRHVAHRWNVLGVIDDRAQVVSMWRSLGLMCAQVAEGDF